MTALSFRVIPFYFFMQLAMQEHEEYIATITKDLLL